MATLNSVETLKIDEHVQKAVEPLILGNLSFNDVTESVSEVPENKMPKGWHDEKKDKRLGGGESDQYVEGVIAEFDNPSSLLEAAKSVRVLGGYSRYDCYSPFPIHGMDTAMGLGQSPLGFIVALVGSIGLAGAVLMEWWMSAIDYPLVYSGKPLFSLPAFIPVIFELTVLTSAFAAVFGLLLLNNLPRFHHPVFYSDYFVKKGSNDGFFIAVYAWDKKFEIDEVVSFLKKIGGKNVEIIQPTEEDLKQIGVK
ncbi:hypothetical protein CHS0354_023980 [Potamilus streckersoni]|uniref:DUF3341 domain-containing protein n=1 Tax=Potamilus streckersoni TaxID=2493646 RepID=A0AAE0VLM3_9BIVA|nr:hypothetical protein CHS0354_023980 [Potamilus streckersoni]